MNEFFYTLLGLALGLAIMFLVCLTRHPKRDAADAELLQFLESRDCTLIHHDKDDSWSVVQGLSKMLASGKDMREVIARAKRSAA